MVRTRSHRRRDGTSATVLSAIVPARQAEICSRVTRRNGDGKDGYQEIAINFSAMQKGKQADMVMQPDDIVYIPFSYFRNIVSNGAGIVASTSSAALYAIP